MKGSRKLPPTMRSHVVLAAIQRHCPHNLELTEESKLTIVQDTPEGRYVTLSHLKVSVANSNERMTDCFTVIFVSTDWTPIEGRACLFGPVGTVVSTWAIGL